MPDSKPKAATVEEWDSDESCARPTTEVQAKQSASVPRRHDQHNMPSRTSKLPQSASRQEPASDSGYSSQNSAAHAKGMPAPSALPLRNLSRQPTSTPMSPTKSNTKKPIIHRVDSARSRSQTVAQPSPKQSTKCDDPNCVDATCQSTRNKERRRTVNLTQSQPPPPTPQSQPHYSYAQAPQHQYSREMPPPALPLQRSASRSSRPLSFHAGMPVPYHTAQPGPPPAQSAYYNYPPGYGQPSAYGATTPSQQMYMPQSPVVPIPPSPTSPSAPGYPGYPGGMISARIPNPNVAGIEAPKLAPHPGLPTRPSARRPDDRAVPGAYNHDEDTTSESESSNYASEDEDRQQRRKEAEEKQRRRVSYVEPRSKSRPRRESRGHDASVAIVTQPSHARRPSMGKSYHTDPHVPTRRSSVRVDPRTERLQRAPYSDTGLDYASSDNFDSDRTARAVVHARHSAPASKQSSRRQSVSASTSSGGTKATTLSSVTDYSKAIIEDSRGRRVVYLSKEQQAELIKQHQRQKLRDSLDEQERLASLRFNAANAYQKEMSGGYDGLEMSAENVKSLNRKSESNSKSHISRRSGVSAGSGSKASRSNGGVKIHAGGTVLHVDGDMAMQVRTGDDGEVHLVLGPNGRETEYNSSSKGGSRSRVSRGRRRDHIPEADEGGYERPL